MKVTNKHGAILGAGSSILAITAIAFSTWGGLPPEASTPNAPTAIESPPAYVVLTGTLIDLEADRVRLFVSGMESNAAGWHVVLPQEFSSNGSRSSFPSIDRYITPTGRPFIAIAGSTGNDYYPTGSPLNGIPLAGIDPIGAVSFERVIINSPITLAVVPDGADYAVEASFTYSAAKYVAITFGNELTKATGYRDWFGVSHYTGTPRTVPRMALVHNNHAYDILNVDTIISDMQPGAIRTYVAARGLTLGEAQAITSNY